MTKDVVCKKGVCRYVDESFDPAKDCVDCNIAEQIEHDLLKKDIGR